MQEPLPIIFDRDLQTATIFSQMPDLQLISQILTPINKQARRIALVEIFSRQTNCARCFQICYIDYIFHHHDQISRIDFISILKQAGLLKRPLKLTEPMSSLLFGAVFHSHPFAAQQLLAHTLADLQWRNLHGRVTHAKAVKALISVYCLAQADSVRDYLFNTIVHRIRDQDQVSIMHCEMLGYLGPYLIERHIQRACDVLNKIEDLLVDQSFASVEPVIRSGLNIPSFSKHAVLLCNERQVGRVQVAHDLFKKIGEERIFYVPPRLKDRVLSEMNRLTTGSSATLGQSLAFYRNEANSLFDSIFSRTICQNPQIPLGLVNLEEMLIAFPDLDEKYLLPLIMAAREYYNDPDHVLTEQQLAKIYLFFRKDWASDDADETKLIMAKLFALVFHKKLTELTSSELYLCLSEFVHVFCRMPALASIVYEYLNSDDFQCNYSDMLSKLEDRNQERFDRFIYYLFICTQSDIQDLYLNRFYKIIINL